MLTTNVSAVIFVVNFPRTLKITVLSIAANLQKCVTENQFSLNPFFLSFKRSLNRLKLLTWKMPNMTHSCCVYTH